MSLPRLIVVPATFKGRAGLSTVQLIVDTGANATMINPQLALEIGCEFPVGESKMVPIITASGMIFLRAVRIPKIACLGETVEDLEVLCHRLPSESTVQGILGLDFLRRVPAFQQFERKILELIQP